MRGTSRFRQMLVVILISLFMIINIPLSTTREPRVEEQASETRTTSDLIHVSGTMGNNGWYISNIQITIHPPQGAGPVFYKFDNGEWSEYSYPIIVDTDGVHTFYVFYMIDGNQSEIFSVGFKIDQTPPFLHATFDKEGHRVIVTVDTFDNMSGVVVVEFYLDGSLLINVTAAPYVFEFSISLFGEHTVSVIVYDAAGNSAEASHTFPYDQSYFPRSLLQYFIRGFQNLILLYQLLIEMNDVSR